MNRTISPRESSVADHTPVMTNLGMAHYEQIKRDIKSVQISIPPPYSGEKFGRVKREFHPQQFKIDEQSCLVSVEFKVMGDAPSGVESQPGSFVQMNTVTIQESFHRVLFIV